MERPPILRVSELLFWRWLFYWDLYIGTCKFNVSNPYLNSNDILYKNWKLKQNPSESTKYAKQSKQPSAERAIAKVVRIPSFKFLASDKNNMVLEEKQISRPRKKNKGPPNVEGISCVLCGCITCQ